MSKEKHLNQFILILTVSCLPVESNWDPTIPSTCVNEEVLFTWALGTDVVIDGMVLMIGFKIPANLFLQA